MKRIATIMSALALAAVGPAAFGTDTASAASNNCNHAYGEVGTIVSANYITHNGERLGAVQLCRDSSKRYWGYVVFYRAMPAGYWANAVLYRFGDSDPLNDPIADCDSSGGNVHVRPGETRCWTPKTSGTNSNYTFKVRGYRYYGTPTDTRHVSGSGTTARTR